MTRQRRIAVSAGSVVLFHGAALWALQSGLVRRAVEIVVPATLLSEFIKPPAPAVQELPRRLQAEAARETQPELHIRGDREVRYERVAQAMAAAQRAGIRKIGFVTEPKD